MAFFSNGWDRNFGGVKHAESTLTEQCWPTLGPWWGCLACVCPGLWPDEGPLSSRYSHGGVPGRDAEQEVMGVWGLRQKKGKSSQKNRSKLDGNEDVWKGLKFMVKLSQ